VATPSVADTFLAYSSKRLRASQRDIARCCDRLSEEQMGHRGGDHENSVANLLLHLAGNLRQWILHGIDGQPDIRRRDEEFALAPPDTAAEARAQFDAALEAAAGVIAELAPKRLLVVIDPQPTGLARHITGLEAIYKVVGHVEQHTGQIILLTKQMTASDLDLTLPRKR
jgi:uncharacterized damage-inducible protein DinB